MDSDLCLYDPSSGNGAACAKCFASAASTKMASETKCWYCHVVHLLCFGELLWKAPPWSKAMCSAICVIGQIQWKAETPATACNSKED